MHTFKKLPIQVPSKKARKGQANVGGVIISLLFPLTRSAGYEASIGPALPGPDNFSLPPQAET